MTKSFSIVAKVHKEIGIGYRVKVSILDLGMYINGMVVMTPNDEHDWSVYPPALRTFKNYTYLIEFDKKLALWSEIYEASIEAVKVWQSADKSEDTHFVRSRPIGADVVLEDIDDEPIDFKDIPF